ncbi:MAG: RecQ family ATP-dependent DNA helicase [Solirubrobacterales bacterium]
MEGISINATPTPEASLDALRRLTRDPSADFRPGQLEAISPLVQGRNSVVCVQRTGWGKSAVYFVATHLLRENGSGPTIIVSPLLALMRDQIEAAKRLGVNVETINSTNTDDWEEVFAALGRDEIDALIISPERLANHEFMRLIGPVFDEVGLFVIDEAHCISDWGHDFRPDYRRLGSVIERLPSGASVLCTTATANDRVVKDIEAQLVASHRPITEIRGSLDRPALRLEVQDFDSVEEKLSWLVTHLHELEGSGIVYCATVWDTQQVATWLRETGHRVAHYFGAMVGDERLIAEDRLKNNEIKALVATNAIGMGYDKPDLGFVVHFQSPGSVVAYYQQVGRAGRALEVADGILLRSDSDFRIQDFFINTAIPPRKNVMDLFDAFEKAESPTPSLRDLQQHINLGQRKIQAMLTMLEVEGAVLRENGRKWTLVDPEWPYDDDRFDELTRLRRLELERMRNYGTDGCCLMRYLREELDEPGAEDCGRCAVCTESRFSDRGSDEMVSKAALFLRSRTYRIKPRKLWSGERRGYIPEESRAKEGLAISRYSDGAYGSMVRKGKYRDGHYSDDLVKISVDRFRKWDAAPSVEWITAVPSLRHPELVPDFARRLAERLRIPYIPAVTKVRDTPPQKERENSFQQATNVAGAFAIDRALAKSGPVLLVDDMCDSKWTITEIAFELNEAGCGPVYPFALADSS